MLGPYTEDTRDGNHCSQFGRRRRRSRQFTVHSSEEEEEVNSQQFRVRKKRRKYTSLAKIPTVNFFLMADA
jgi:hypothetical protein